jgi:hypothetical protein
MFNIPISEIDTLLHQLKNGTIKYDHKLKGEFHDIGLLDMVLSSRYSIATKHNLIERFIKLGCDVDEFSYSSTPLSNAAFGAEEGDLTKIVSLMLEYHKKGHMSEHNILKSAAKSFDDNMFKTVIQHKNIDINTTRFKGSHILHYLAETEGYDTHIKDLFLFRPDVIVNPINRKGFSPLALSINNKLDFNIIDLLMNIDARIFGEITNPQAIIDYEIVDRYDGGSIKFWQDHGDVMSYALKSNKGSLLPQEVIDTFLF